MIRKYSVRIFVTSRYKRNKVMTRNEFKKLVEKVNETLSTAKNSVKFTKCLSMLESALVS